LTSIEINAAYMEKYAQGVHLWVIVMVGGGSLLDLLSDPKNTIKSDNTKKYHHKFQGTNKIPTQILEHKKIPSQILEYKKYLVCWFVPRDLCLGIGDRQTKLKPF
jgi:hypothetical protein